MPGNRPSGFRRHFRAASMTRSEARHTQMGFLQTEIEGCKECGLKWIDKPDSVVTDNSSHSDHSSCPLIAQEVERPYPRAMGGPPYPPIWPCSRWGLPCVRHHWRTGELLPRLFNLTRAEAPGGIFSVVLSPDYSGPPLTATLSCGVRTFLPLVRAHGERSLDPL